MIRDSVRSVMLRVGAVYTLRTATVSAGANAWTNGAAIAAYSTCRAHERRFKPNEIAGGIQEGDVLITVDASTLLQAPKVGDRIALGEFTADAGAEWRQVTNVYAPREGGVVAAYRLTARR